MKFPTSGIAVLRVPVSWSALELSGAGLVSFHVPRVRRSSCEACSHHALSR